MNKIELVAAMSAKSELSKKDAEKALSAFMEVVKETLISGDKIYLVGFGTFEAVERAERQGRNPQTSETIIIPSCTTMKFKISKTFKNALNQ